MLGNLLPKSVQPHRGAFPYLVLLGSVLLTAMATISIELSARTRDRLRFDTAIQRVENQIQDRFKTYIALLRAGNGLFVASQQVDQKEFRAFANHLELRQEYPGTQGIGFSIRVSPTQKEVLIAEMRRQGSASFSIRPSNDRDEYHAILYLEPLDQRNQAAIGYDMFTEPVRREAMERARDSGNPAASGRVTLMQEIDQHKQAGFLIYVPVYLGDSIPTTVAERQAALRGFVYSPFRADDFIRGIFGDNLNSYVDFLIYDGTEIDREHLLHRSKAEENNSPHSRFAATTSLEVAGRPWLLVFHSRPELDRNSERRLVPFIAMTGGLLSLILFGITRSQVRAWTAAEKSASELRQSEQALRESEQRFQTFMDHNPAAAWIIDPNGDIVYLSQTYYHMFNVAQDAVGKTMNEIYPTETAEQALENLRMVIAEKRVVETVESASRPDGNLGEFLVYKFPILDSSGNNLVGGLVIDITERKQVERECEQLLIREKAARAEAEQANRIKDEFLAVLSHELRSPLNPILGWSRLLRSGQLDATKTAYALETIERNAKLQTQLIEDLLDVSRILQGKLNLRIAPVDLVPVMAAALETVRLAAEAKSINLNFEVRGGTVPLPPRDEETQINSSAIWNSDQSLRPEFGTAVLPIQVLGDAARLQQIMWNLLSNAVKFSPEGGQVDVRLERQLEIGNQHSEALPFIQTPVQRSIQEQPNSPTDPAATPEPNPPQPSQYVEIVVTDTGKGIDPEFLPYVFDYFRQSDSKTTRQFGGLGLGLAIVRHLVELHGGTVHAASLGENKGSTFTVRLPLLKHPPNPEAPGFWLNNEQDGRSSSTAHSLPLANRRILVVDDDADMREFLTFFLEQNGAEVTTVASATEALQSLTPFQPDLLLSDIGMPETDGYMLIRQIRERSLDQGGQMPAIAITAYAGEINQQQALAAGFQQHLSKPVEPEVLLRTIVTLLNHQWE